MKNRGSTDTESDMQQLLVEKWRLFADAIAGIDDPHGEYLRVLEDRIRRLEGEMEDVRKRLLMDTPASAQSADASPV